MDALLTFLLVILTGVTCIAFISVFGFVGFFGIILLWIIHEKLNN